MRSPYPRTNAASSSGIRRLFEPSETVYLRCYVRLSKDWGWSGRAYHPHLMHCHISRQLGIQRIQEVAFRV